jgi:kinesin family protein 5
LGGNSKTCLIITCSPSVYNNAETISTLRFGKRAKEIKNKPKINKEVSVGELKLQLEKLEKTLEVREKHINHLEKALNMANNTIT